MDLSTLQLSDALTAAGAVGFAALITGVIAIAKNLRGIGPYIDNGNEPTVAFVLSALVVLGAMAQVVTVLTPQTILVGVVAWYGIATLSMGIHTSSTTVLPIVTTTTPVTTVDPPPAG